MSAQQSFCDALLDPERPCPAGLRVWNGSDPAVRFGIYRNNVAVSLVDGLAETFPVTRELVGEPFFRAMARVFATGAPPRSPVLVRWGEDFPAFVAGFPPAAGLPYLADLARLELARVRAYHAAEADALGAEDLSGYLGNPDHLPGACLILHPSLAVLVSDHAIVSLWAAHQGRGRIEEVDPVRPESALILREGDDVVVLPVGRGTAAFIAELTMAPLCAAAAAGAAKDPRFDLVQALVQDLGCAAERVGTEQQAGFKGFELVVASSGCWIDTL